jgi:hypothetical protein
MSITWMQHKDHGVMPCYEQSTIDSNLKNGWTYRDKEETVTPDVTPESIPEIIETVKKTRKRKV